jgi:hypothetical protein
MGASACKLLKEPLGASGVAAVLGVGFVAGIAVCGSLRMGTVGQRPAQQQQQQQQQVLDDDDAAALPSWFRSIQSDRSGRYKEVRVREWDSPAWRSSHGWHGSDLIHNRSSKGVRVRWELRHLHYVSPI